MQAEDYLILQLPEEALDRQRPVRRGRFPDVASRSARDMSADDAIAKRITLSPRDVGQIAEDPTTVGLARVLPTRLHRPVPRSEVASDGDREAIAWGVQAVGADSSPFSGLGISVAVLDTGIKMDHPAFAGKDPLIEDFTDTTVDDVDGHGTHCAGTIFGEDVDGIRIGIARDARPLIGKVLHGEQGDTDGLIRALIWATENGADIVSLSLGIDFPGYIAEQQADGIQSETAISMGLEAYVATLEIYRKLIDFLLVANGAHGPLFIAAAGNASDHSADPPVELSVEPPAVADAVVSVGAVGRGSDGLRLAEFSNINPDLVAPGVDVLSASLDGGLTPLTGTSMATPHVAGVAALWAQSLARPGERAPHSQVHASVTARTSLSGLVGPVRQADVGAGLAKAPT